MIRKWRECLSIRGSRWRKMYRLRSKRRKRWKIEEIRKKPLILNNKKSQRTKKRSLTQTSIAIPSLTVLLKNNKRSRTKFPRGRKKELKFKLEA